MREINQQTVIGIISPHIYTDQTELVNKMFEFKQFNTSDIKNYDEVYPLSIVEWWSVSSRLRTSLKRRGELVLENNYGAWWGRQTPFKQSIFKDEVLVNITTSIQNIRNGQKGE